MEGLYKGKYLIAMYDKQDNSIDVGCNPSELNTIFKTKNAANSHFSHVWAGRRVDHRVHLIDVTEIHDDIFAEEDEIFLQFLNNREHITEDRLSDKVKAERLGVSLRTYTRHKAKGTLYKLEKKLKAKRRENENKGTD